MANDISSSFRTEVLSLNDQVYIMEGDFNPSEGAGQAATKGSLFMQRDTTDLFKKIGPLDTDWVIVASADAATIFGTMQEPTGHVNRVDSEILFDTGTRTFTIQPRGPATEYDYYIKGAKHTISAVKNYVIPDVTGLYFIYFDENEDLQHQAIFSYDLLSIYAYTAIVYWNSSQQRLVYFGDERHGITMDGQTHTYLHLTVGTQFIMGLAVNGSLNPEVGTPTDADVQIDVGNGIIRDEDLEHYIADTGTGSNVYDLIQELSPTAQLPVLWRTGPNGDWNITQPNNFPFIYSDGVNFTGASGRPPWNQYTGATWQLTEVGNNRYFLVHILATNDVNNPIVALQGIEEYQNKPAGRDAAVAELGQMTGLPFEEYFPIITLIYETRDVYTNTPKVRARATEEGNDYVDWRYTDSFVFKVIGGGVNDHGNLTGLADDDHLQYALAGSGSTRTFDLGDLNDVTDLVSPTNTESHVLVWDAGNGWYDVTASTLTLLNDVSVSNGPAIDGYVLTYNDTAGLWQAQPPGAASDELAKVSANDTTAGYLNGKLVAGTSISLVENNDGLNETLSIVNTAPNVDQNLWATISSDSGNTTADSTTDTLTVSGGTGISTAIVGDVVTITNDSPNVDQNVWETVTADTGSTTANTTTDTLTVAGGTGISTAIVGDTLTVTATGGVGSDELVKVSTNDTTAGFLDSELVVGTGLAKAILNPAADETLELSLNASLDDLTDVTVTGPIPDNSRIKYDTGTNQWVNAPDVPAPPSGGELLVQLVWSPIGTLSGTASIPRDSSTPLITEGLELWSDTITPTETTSTIRVASSFTWFHTNASRNLAIAVFRDNTCVGVAEDTVADNNEGQTVHFVIYDTPATTSTITYSVRVGKAGGGPGTFYLNAHTSITNMYGGLMQNNAYSIEEIGTVV